MELQFSQYQYSFNKRVLYKKDELIVLKRNQTLLLEYFLLNPNDIHSKDDIMDVVWQNKVVSEQVVFQTISQLRAIFGEQSIKTYSKKGYRWQYSITNVNSHRVHNKIPKPGYYKKQPYSTYLIISCIFALLIVLLTSQLQTTASKTQLYYANNAHSTDKSNNFTLFDVDTLKNNQLFSVKSIDLTDTNRQNFLSPQQAWASARLALDTWLIWNDMYPSEKGVFIHYGLSSNARHWQGYIFGETATKAKRALLKQLNLLHTLGFFSTRKPLGLAELKAMHSNAPDNEELSLLLAKHLIYAEQPDIAMVHLDKILNQKGREQKAYRAQAHWLLGKIYKKRKQHPQSAYRLTLMNQELQNTSLLPLQHNYINTTAWLYYEQGNIKQMFSTLEEAITLTKQQKVPLAQFEFHMLYSILAKKVGDVVKQYAQLNKAQALLIAHNLHDSNKAIVYFHFALFTEDNTLALPYLKRILAIPRTENNYWVLDNALEMLVSHYIETSDFQAAHALLTDSINQPAQLLLKAQVLLAQNLIDDARPLFQDAFNKARLAHNKPVSLNSALALYHLAHKTPELKGEYLAFLQTNGSEHWLKQHGVTSAIALEH